MTVTAAQKPFVHLFHTDNVKYAYDVNSGLVAEVDNLRWTLLAEWDKTDEEIAASAGNGVTAEAVETARNRIRELGDNAELFSARRPRAIKSHHSREGAERKLSHECHQLILCATEACNMRCSYCYYTSGRDSERGHGSAMMTWETAHRALDFFFEHSVESMAKYKAQQAELAQGKHVASNDIEPKPCVGFYGGEPLLNWPLMKRVAEYVRSSKDGGEFLINCTVNGTLLTPEIMRFMARHNFSLNVSLDGPKDIHDRYRRTAGGAATWDTIKANLMYMRDNLRDFYDNRVSLLGVMAPPNNLRCLMEFVETADWLPERGIRFNGLEYGSPQCFWNPLGREEQEIVSDGLWEEFVEATVAGKYLGGRRDTLGGGKERRRLSFLRQMYNLEMAHVYNRVRQMFEGKNILPEVMASNFGMCLPGQERIYVRIDGKILPCERLPSEAPDLVIGDLDSGFDIDAIMRLCDGNAALLADKCVNCWNIRMCAIPCHRILGPDGRLSREAKLKACEETRLRCHHALVGMCAILERNPRALDHLKRI